MGDSMEDTNDMGGEVTEGMNSLVVATPAKKETKPKNPRKTPAKKEAASVSHCYSYLIIIANFWITGERRA